eukprot:280945-Pelagomonas_calceolata.AAC.1
MSGRRSQCAIGGNRSFQKEKRRSKIDLFGTPCAGFLQGKWLNFCISPTTGGWLGMEIESQLTLCWRRSPQALFSGHGSHLYFCPSTLASPGAGVAGPATHCISKLDANFSALTSQLVMQITPLLIHKLIITLQLEIWTSVGSASWNGLQVDCGVSGTGTTQTPDPAKASTKADEVYFTGAVLGA